MQHSAPLARSPQDFLNRHQPDHPVLFFAPTVLQATAQQFQAGFGGQVTYAVKANDRPEVLGNLVAAGITAFDVASPGEINAVRAADPRAVLHYNNPMRSAAEVALGIAAGVHSWSLDHACELGKLADVPREAEVAVRFALPIKGAAYDFGAKFGASPEAAIALLQQVSQAGFTPALSFHPGTQCEDPKAWVAYIVEAARISTAAGVRIARLNVGGGFAADRGAGQPDHSAVFEAITRAVASSFGAKAPRLVCEPGRAMVAPSCSLATRIKGRRGQTIYLNDGIYGGLADQRDMGVTGLIRVLGPSGARGGATEPHVVFGPTCDSLDRLPGRVALPLTTQVGDYLVFDAMGAYSIAISTRFNGYGVQDMQMVQTLA